MLSISDPLKSVNQISAYYLEGKDDYYLNGTAVRGRWAGSAASELGLGEFVQPGEFLHSLSGFSPDGKTALVQNAGDPNRVSAWDFTFSAPKDASIVWAMLPEKERAKVEIAHRKAVDTALECAEVLFASTRRGKGGKFHERGKLLAATFEEFVSRAQDMQIHTHCVLFNTVLRKDGTAGALHSINLFRAKKFLGAVYQSEFAFQLGKNLGFKIRPERVGFGIDGIPDKIRKHYSKRRAAIQAEQKNHGLFGAIAAKIIARNTRPKKDKIAPSKLFSFWQGEGRALGWGKVQAHALVQAATFEQGHPHSIKEALFSLPQEDRTHKHVLENARQTAIRTHLGGRDLWKELSSFKLPNGQSALWQPTNTKPPKNRAPVQANAGPPVTQTLPECPKVNAILTVPEQFVKTVRGSSQEQKFNGSSASGETAGKEQQKKNFDTQDQKSKKDDAKKQRAEALKAKRKQKARNVAFDRAFNAAVDEIFREKQTRRRLTWVALKLVIKYDADPETLERVLANRTPGAEQGFFHIERPRIFPKSPISPIKWWRVPKVVAGDKPRRWSNIRWKKELVIGELRVQSRRLFPKAPKWSPLHKLEIPALRFTLKKSKWKPLERRQKTSRQDARVAKQSSRDQSQSQ